MKRFLSLFLALVMALTLAAPAFAADVSTSSWQNSSKGMDSITLRLLYGNILEEVNTNNASPYSSDLIIAQKSEQNPDVYILSDSCTYVMAIGENQYQLADKIELFITESSQIDELKVPQEVKDTITQDLLSSPNGHVEGAIFAPAEKQTRDTLNTTDYTYKGYNMRQYLYTYNNFEATNTNVTKGIKTKERISAAIDFIFTAITSVPSETIEKLSPFTSIASLLKDFLTITQSDAAFVGSSDDSFYITPHWNRYLKFTYCDCFHDGNYFLGLKSICAQLTKIEYDLYFRNANQGNNVDFTKNINKTIYSPNYRAPDETAIACATTEARLEDTLIWQIYSKTPAEENAGKQGTLLCTVYIT